MRAAQTEHDKMLKEVHEFTRAVIAVTEMTNSPMQDRVDTILAMEYLFHSLIMKKILDKCVEKATPCNN